MAKRLLQWKSTKCWRIDINGWYVRAVTFSKLHNSLEIGEKMIRLKKKLIVGVLLVTLIISLVGVASLSATSGEINWTFLIATLTVCLTAMATLIKIFSSPNSKEDLPGPENPFCQQQIQAIEKMKTEMESTSEKNEKAREVVTEIDKIVATMLKDNENINKGIDEIKRDYRELAHKLDGLLKQLISWMSED